MARSSGFDGPGFFGSVKGAFRPIPLALVCAGWAVCLWIAGEAPKASPANVAPSAHFVTSPLDGAVVSARISIEWKGSDPDGFIDHFEYSVDTQDWVATPDTIGNFVFSTHEAESTLVGSQKIPLA